MTKGSKIVRAGGVAVLLQAATFAVALPPDQLYERVSPGVWQVKAYAAEEKLLASASGVVVAPGKVVTSCQVLARARQVQLRRGNAIFDAKLEFPDVERDLCQLDVPGLSAPAPALGSARGLRPGQRLYVVGFARGNEQSLGEGLVSALADGGSDKERLQTTVPASPGLRGAGVFDEEARLVGIVTSSPRDAAASTFALPADWLAELAARGQAALAARASPPAAGGPIAQVVRQEALGCLRAAGVDFDAAGAAARGQEVTPKPIGDNARPGGSSWQSLTRGAGSIETDYLNGAIVLLGRLAGVPTPANALLQRWSNELAQTRSAPGALSEQAFLERLEGLTRP
jgi:S1-C subfamily serine protease